MLTALATIVAYALAVVAVMLATVLSRRRRDPLGEELDRFLGGVLGGVLGRPGHVLRAGTARRAWLPVVASRSRRSVPCGDPR
ncbi:MAG: hypothetical protein ACYCR4_10825 [Acidimicrobiales bacterium]